MKSTVRIVILLAFVASLAARAEAAPIVYVGTLVNGVPADGINGQAAGNQSNPIGADYWQFYANAGAVIDLFGDRQVDGHFDMSFYVFAGLFADTAAFGPTFDNLDPGYIAFGDDQDGPNIPGPFGDPHVVFNAPSTGFYTVAVTSFLSSAGPPNVYTLQANGVVAPVPEPASMLLLGSGISGLIAARRRRKARVQ